MIHVKGVFDLQIHVTSTPFWHSARFVRYCIAQPEANAIVTRIDWNKLFKTSCTYNPRYDRNHQMRICACSACSAEKRGTRQAMTPLGHRPKTPPTCSRVIQLWLNTLQARSQEFSWGVPSLPSLPFPFIPSLLLPLLSPFPSPFLPLPLSPSPPITLEVGPLRSS